MVLLPICHSSPPSPVSSREDTGLAASWMQSERCSRSSPGLALPLGQEGGERAGLLRGHSAPRALPAIAVCRVAQLARSGSWFGFKNNHFSPRPELFFSWIGSISHMRHNVPVQGPLEPPAPPWHPSSFCNCTEGVWCAQGWGSYRTPQGVTTVKKPDEDIFRSAAGSQRCEWIWWQEEWGTLRNQLVGKACFFWSVFDTQLKCFSSLMGCYTSESPLITLSTRPYPPASRQSAPPYLQTANEINSLGLVRCKLDIAWPFNKYIQRKRRVWKNKS